MLAEYLSTYNLYSSIKYFIPIAVKFIISNHKNSSWHLWFAITSVTYFTPSFVKLILEMFNFVSWQLSLSIAFARCRAPSLPILFLEISNSLVLPSLTSCASCAHPRGPMLLFDTSIGLPLSNAYMQKNTRAPQSLSVNSWKNKAILELLSFETTCLDFSSSLNSNKQWINCK